MKLIALLLLLSVGLFAQFPGRDTYSHNILWNEFHPATKDSIRSLISDSIIVIYPIPSDSVSPDTSYVSADSGLGGGGWLELGDSIGVHVNVDSITIDILDDTLRVDTTNIATVTYVNDTLVAYWDTTNVKDIVSDSSQYYYWRSLSKDHYPSYSNLVPWDLNDYQTDQDSVFICFWAEAATFKPYIEVKADSNSTDSQYVHLLYSFTAPRGVSNITDTLFIVEFKTSVADTDSVGCELMIYEGATARYTGDSLTASASWTTKAIKRTQGSLTSIIAGDRFSLIVRVKARKSAGATDPTTWVSRIRERWY